MVKNSQRSSSPLDHVFSLFGDPALRDIGERTIRDLAGPTWTSVRETVFTNPSDSTKGLRDEAVVENGRFVATCDMPGVSRKSLTVTVKGARIKAVGVRGAAADSTITREWSFPDVDPTTVKASIKDGVLTVKASVAMPPEAEEFQVQVD